VPQKTQKWSRSNGKVKVLKSIMAWQKWFALHEGFSTDILTFYILSACAISSNVASTH
jgi:hypothetical protein